MSATGSCPGCGSPLTFRVATTTTAVCGYCRSIVVRAGTNVELIGKSNAVLVTGSVLRLGLTGRVAGRSFTLVGRTQLQHDLGGTWDEWLVAFDDGRLAWLAEHQGRFALTAEHHLKEAPRLASPAHAQPGARHLSGFGELIVIERGEATIMAEEGELPGRSLPGSRRPFIDFSGRGGQFATLDFGAIAPDGTREPTRFFVGKEVTLDKLGLATAELQEAQLPAAAGATALRCPHCGAPVERKLAETESISCGHCASVLSVDKDNQLAVLFAQDKLRFKPVIALGTKAVLDDGFFMRAARIGVQARPWPDSLAVEVVAHMVRSVVVDGVRYYFQEYLLHTEKQGFFWLVETDGNWLFVRTIEAGLVTEQRGVARLEDKAFRLEQSTRAEVEQVTGELYWRVNKGDTSLLVDYKNAPRTLSKETTPNEVIWTECLDVPREELARVFRLPLGVLATASADDDHSPTGTQVEIPPQAVAAIAVGLLLVLFVFPLAFDGCAVSSGGGGGHYSSGGSSSGYSFGK